MSKRLSLLVVLCCFVALAAVAQAPQTKNTICQIVTNKVKPGMTAQYEAARTKHMAWHKAQKDTWSWDTWEVMSGEDTGNYVVGSCGHQWADFDGRDKFDAADTANINITVGPTLTGQTVAYYVLRADLATPPPDSATAPTYLQITHFYVKPEGVGDFNDGIRKVNAGMAKTNYPQARSSWYTLANGGNGPEYVLVTERKSMSEMQPPAKSLDQMMQEAYGDQGAAILSNLRKGYWHTKSYMLRFRSELSYMPAPAKK